MASERDRKRARKVDALNELSEEGSIFDLDEFIENDSSPAIALAQIAKSPLYFVLMLRSKNFPLNPGDAVYVNPGNKMGRPVGTAVILESGELRTTDSVESSLAALAKKYQPWNRKKSKWPDGWETVKVPYGASKYISLNQLFMEYWEQLEVKLDTLKDEVLLLEYMVNCQMVTREQGMTLIGDQTRKRINQKKEDINE